MKSSAPHTLLLVDDHPMMRRGIRQLIELESDLCVVGEANNGEEAIVLVAQLNPELVLLDNNMPQLNGVETLKRLREQHYDGKVLLFTVSDAEHDVRDAMRFGADGYLLKDMEPELLIMRLREALQGALVVSSALTTVLAQALRAPQSASSLDLTDGVLQGSCRVSRVFKLLFSLPAAPSLG
ncbi:response regulator [Pseudomonas sp. GWSMS-1]|uniref:response regulator n=1 Tax=Pseudomonas sp. GWSMS-1 TaxID=3308997 RepID=UPI003CF4FB31